jgi:acetyltransferase-like isoleucine patch superfamily enzyme
MTLTVVGARVVVMKDVEPGHIVVGNPAKTIRRLKA